MIQDLEYGRLENEYCKAEPEESDFVFCFKDGCVLIFRDDNVFLKLPRIEDVKKICNISSQNLQYLFRFQNTNCFLCFDAPEECVDSHLCYEKVRTLRELRSKDVCFAFMTAWHLYSWYSSNKYCGRCGALNVHDDIERMMRCPECGGMYYPKISPAVIIAVTNGDKLLLSKYAGRNYNRFALIAGYTEIGETLEQTVRREVMEEVGLKVKNIRYYKSQPWGVDGNILMGFFCELEGNSEIHLDFNELSYANWYARGEIPCEDDGISLTREMIRVFDENKF